MQSILPAFTVIQSCQTVACRPMHDSNTAETRNWLWRFVVNPELPPGHIVNYDDLDASMGTYVSIVLLSSVHIFRRSCRAPSYVAVQDFIIAFIVHTPEV
jgi:hypothetical protein